MQVEQATFTSAQTHTRQGYHLVARSSGIGKELEQVLSTWGPSHASLVDTGRSGSSLNVFPVGKDHVAFTRTVFGGPEYSGRGGLQVVTRIIVFRAEQLAGFNFDLTSVMRLACARGLLHLYPIEGQQLPAVEFPENSILVYRRETESRGTDRSRFTEDVLQLLAKNRQVMVVGSEDPLSLAHDVLQLTPPRHRINLSFATGLNPSAHRPFRLQFLPAIDDALQRKLDTQGIVCTAQQLAPAV